MTSRLVAGWICALLTMVPSEATADWIVRPFFGAAVSPKHGFVDLEQTSGDSKLVLGAAAGWHRRAIGVEFEVSVLPGFFDGPGDLIISGNVTTLMGNVTWQLPKPHESSRLRAYVAGGAGIVRVRLEDALDAFSSRTSLAGGNAGGGVLVRLRPRLDINADVRYFKTQYGDVDRAGFSEQFVSFTRLTGGVVLRF
jgi:outer membrane protein with beta-barrel domain